MRYLVFGKGFLGTLFGERVKGEIVYANANLVDYLDVVNEIKKISPDIVVNFAGKTGGTNTDWCDLHKFETISSNLVGVFNLAQACFQENTYLIHIDSGSVYDGDNNGKGFSEDDLPNFTGNFYSLTKAWSQQILKERFPQFLVLRIKMAVDWKKNPRNLVDKLSTYSKIITGVPNSITICDDLFNAIEFLGEKRLSGEFNVVNKNPITWEEFIAAYIELVDPNFSCTFISPEELSNITLVKRSYSVLTTDKLELTGFKVREVHEALRDTLKKYAATNK
ncbi:RmlD substrate binding domain protein [uncultured archaeon]|nr:RmlD substrate binding domain protein [uncultured archaeon]